MGTTFVSIHIYENNAIEDSFFKFSSFSDGWQTNVTDLSEIDFNTIFKNVKRISKTCDAPVLWFSVNDSDYMDFAFYVKGKLSAKYSFESKNLYGIPGLIGLGEGNKKRLSNILQAADIDERIALLEEYFGVCLLPFPECFATPEILKRERSDRLYLEYTKKNKAIMKAGASISAKIVAEYDGKLFANVFGEHETVKEHCFLYGYKDENDQLAPVRFCGGALEPITAEEFNTDRIPDQIKQDEFEIKFGGVCSVTFKDKSPEAYVGKTMNLPNGYFPFGFDSKERLVLCSERGIAVVNKNLEIIAKVSLKGDIDDMVDDYILTTTGGSFFAYLYEPNAKIRIYQLTDK